MIKKFLLISGLFLIYNIKLNASIETDNITNFNIAMIEARQQNYLKSLIYLEHIKTSNKTLYFKKVYYTELIKYFKYNRIILFTKKLKILVDDIKEFGIRNEEILIIYLKTIIELYNNTTDIKLLKKNISFIEELNLKSLNNESKILLTNVYILSKNYKKALFLYKTIISPNFKYLSILYLLNKDYKNSLFYLNKIENNLNNYENEWLKLFLNLKIKNKNNILKITTSKDIKKIFKYKKKYPIILGVKDSIFQYKYAKKKLLKLKNKYNDIFIDFLFYHLKLKYNPKLISNYINTEDIFNGINSSDLIEKNKKIKSFEIIKKIKNKEPYEKIKIYENYINKIKVPDSYDLYNLGILYGQVKDYKHSYLYFYKSFFKNPQLYRAGLFIVLLNKYKINASTTLNDIKLISKIIHNSNDKSSIFLFDYFYNKSSFIINEKENNKFEHFVFNYINYLETKNNKYLENIKNDNNLSNLIYILYKNIHNSLYSFSSYIQDNINIKQLLFYKEPFIVGELNILFLQSSNYINKINELNIKNSLKSSYLRNYAILKTIQGYYSEADSIFDYLANSYDINDFNSFLYSLICKIKLKKIDEEKLLIEKGVNLFKTNEMNLIKSLLYLNIEDINIFNLLLNKEFSEEIITIDIKNIENVLLK